MTWGGGGKWNGKREGELCGEEGEEQEGEMNKWDRFRVCFLNGKKRKDVHGLVCVGISFSPSCILWLCGW